MSKHLSKEGVLAGDADAGSREKPVVDQPPGTAQSRWRIPVSDEIKTSDTPWVRPYSWSALWSYRAEGIIHCVFYGQGTTEASAVADMLFKVARRLDHGDLERAA